MGMNSGFENIVIPVIVSCKDVSAFAKVLNEKLETFKQRRSMYGSHLDNAQRFPKEHLYGLYLKAVRFIRMVESGKDIDHDTLLDLSNYADILLSAQESE